MYGFNAQTQKGKKAANLRLDILREKLQPILYHHYGSNVTPELKQQLDEARIKVAIGFLIYCVVSCLTCALWVGPMYPGFGIIAQAKPVWAPIDKPLDNLDFVIGSFLILVVPIAVAYIAIVTPSPQFVCFYFVFLNLSTSISALLIHLKKFSWPTMDEPFTWGVDTRFLLALVICNVLALFPAFSYTVSLQILFNFGKPKKTKQKNK